MSVRSYPPPARILSLVGLGFLLTLSCSTDRTLTAPAWVELVPTFQVTPGPPNETGCDEGVNFVREPHLGPAPAPPTLFYDSISEYAGQCGALDFDGRLRWFEVTYSTGMPGEYPYKYWWTRSRDRETGGTLGLWDTLIVLDSGIVDSARVIEMRLDTRSDAVATVLLVTDDGSYEVTDSAFLDPNWYGIYDQNFFVQHWRGVPQPVLDSVVVTGPLAVSLWWRNGEGVDRVIDSTVVFRNDVEIATVPGDLHTLPDTVPGPDTYRYSLKHLTWPLFAAPYKPSAMPNSSSSNERQVTFSPPPPLLDMDISGRDLITQTGWHTWEMAISGGETPYGPYLWEYKVHGTSTWTDVGDEVEYTRYVRTSDPWFWLRATVWDAAQDSVKRLLAVEVWEDEGKRGDLGTAVGVRLPDGTCSPRPAPGDAGRQAWLQMVMTTVKQIEYCRVTEVTS